MTKKILIIHGPNLNMLGKREKSIYGNKTLSDINSFLEKEAKRLELYLKIKQFNAEHEIITLIHQASIDKIDFVIINAAAYTHTSVAIRDALLAVDIPFIEVHLSNVYAREAFRHKSYLSDIAIGVISGFGELSYSLAMSAAKKQLEKETI